MPEVRPTDAPPEWATADLTDGVSGTANVIEPPEEKKLAGWNRAEHPARQWLNWFQRRAGEWLVYLADRDSYIPINTLVIGAVADVLPAVPTGDNVFTGSIYVVNNTDTAEYFHGFVYGNDLGYVVTEITSNVLAVTSVSGRNIVVTGADAEDLTVNTILSKVTA